MKTILKYLFCSLLVLVYIHEGYGQKKRVVGPNIGYDVSQIAKGYFYPGYSAHVLSLDYEIDYLYYPVIEAGLFDLNKDQESMNYSSDGRFVKLGMDYNVIGIQGPWDYDMLFGGARIGVAQYNHSARDIVIENNYWGDYQADNIEKAAKLCAERVRNDQIIHMVGSGHSHMIAEELFVRAGGLANVNSWLDLSLIPTAGARKTGKLERLEGLAEILWEEQKVDQDDLLVIISNSGRNSVPVETAILARDKGIYTI
ncbi:MAG: sugar isomerase domain-containing protein, partial [Bacteroidales bacterium]